MGESKPLLVIIRGLPGSGKSTLADTEYPDYLHYELDHLFCDTKGRYRFDMQLFDEAQHFVLQMTDFALARCESVVVSDVFPKLTDFEPFVKMADAHGADFTVIDCVEQFGNCHRVPVSVISRMREQFEPWIGSEWERSYSSDIENKHNRQDFFKNKPVPDGFPDSFPELCEVDG